MFSRDLVWGQRMPGRDVQCLDGVSIKIRRYWLYMNQAGDRKEDCIWLYEIKVS